MNHKPVTIAVDAMGGDDAPYKTLKGVSIFLKNNKDTKIILLGDKKNIKDIIESKKIHIYNCEIINTTQNISNVDSTNNILRNRKDSSIYKGLEIVKNNNKTGFVSAGNTAALMILSRLILGTIEGIDRPAICSIIPNKQDFSIMMDLGANVTVSAENLFQFAIMGFFYHSILKKNTTPKIGIINIGTENNKGLEFLQEASDLIKNSFLKNYYIGFVEPDKITSGICDIMISDGYTGNIMLKTAEGMSQFITGNLKEIFYKSFLNKLSYQILSKDLKKFKDNINPEKYNGAIFIGINGVSVKSHGSASSKGFAHALQKCFDFINNDINEKIRNKFNKI